jgi:hypothetical protein
MRALPLAASLLLLALGGCGTIETQHSDIAQFEASGFTYYTWRSEPLRNTTGSADALYIMDPIVRREVNANLAERGYVLDPARAQFSVDYLQATGLREGVSSQDASGGIDPIPSARPNRQINQAMVDNAHALAGLQTTSNIAIQFNDVTTQREIWRVIITKIVDDVNEPDPATVERNLERGISKALKSLPEAGR